MSNTVILTGLRANNDLTIGNYFGAMLPMIDMATSRASEYQVNMFIPDLHSFTTPIDHSKLYDQIMHNARVFVAAGLPLDADGIYLYRQSFVPAHSELTWILDCFTGMGEMARMTQYKEKSHKEINDALKAAGALDVNGNPGNASMQQIRSLDQNTNRYSVSNASVGLFNYPVLMAADILLYGAKYVPVGDDQTQHLEFARDIAERMNSHFGELFVVPEPVLKQHEFFGKDQGLRIMDLVHPDRKMSKSDDTGKGVIFLGDDPDEAAKKVMGATTDNLARVAYDRENQPGISNLIEILSLLRKVPKQVIVDEFGGMERYGDFKKIVADEVKNFLTDFQAKLAAVDDADVLAKLERSEAAMREQANTTLARVQQAVGLRA